MEAHEYDRLAALEDKLWYFRALRRRTIDALDAADLQRGAALLDAGCGTGGFLRAVQTWRPDLQLAGIDISPSACDRARREGCDVREGSIEELPWEDGAFAAITSLDVLTQIEAPLLALVEFFRCLRAGGILVVNGAALKSLWSYHDERVRSLRRFRRRELRRLAQEAGFRVEFATYWNSLLLPLVFARRKLWPPRDRETVSDVRPLWPPLNAALTSVAALECAINRRHVALPLGSSVFMVARKPERPARVRLQ